MADLTQLVEEHKDLSEAAQKQAGQAIGGAMPDEHKNFLMTVTTLIKAKEIDAFQPRTFLHQDVYDSLSQEAREQVDLSMVNLADLLRHITDFFLSKKTPDESPHLQNMIEQLWLMKDRVEEKVGDVFKF
ncbi:MAG: hypothetical protein Greene041619_1142 [Candidatus Peregrinibacteria bacterium Greene0416_19]|nr:MAG: hypothetical protein Greene041619_1142 [Candidatus Peregrinibacteria bacterium Greene0416_19]